MPPSASEPRTSWRRTTAAWEGSTPWPMTAWESESAVEMARPARREAGVDGDGGDDDAGQDVFDGGAGLEGLVAHDDRPADQDEQDQEGVGDALGHLPQLADPGLGGDVRGGEQGVAEQGEDRVEGGGDEVAEPVVDGGLDVTGDVEQARRGLAAAAHAAAAAWRRGGGRGGVAGADLDARSARRPSPVARWRGRWSSARLVVSGGERNDSTCAAVADVGTVRLAWWPLAPRASTATRPPSAPTSSVAATGNERAQPGHPQPPTIEARMDTSSGAKMASA